MKFHNQSIWEIVRCHWQDWFRGEKFFSRSLEEVRSSKSLGSKKGWSSNTLASWCKELTPWKRPWCWERLRAGGEGDDRGWDGWVASLTRWNLSKLWETVKDREACSAAVRGVAKSQTKLSTHVWIPFSEFYTPLEHITETKQLLLNMLEWGHSIQERWPDPEYLRKHWATFPILFGLQPGLELQVFYNWKAGLCTLWVDSFAGEKNAWFLLFLLFQ